MLNKASQFESKRSIQEEMPSGHVCHDAGKTRQNDRAHTAFERVTLVKVQKKGLVVEWQRHCSV